MWQQGGDSTGKHGVQVSIFLSICWHDSGSVSLCWGGQACVSHLQGSTNRCLIPLQQTIFHRWNWKGSLPSCFSSCFPFVGMRLFTHHFAVLLVPILLSFYSITLCCWPLLSHFLQVVFFRSIFRDSSHLRALLSSPFLQYSYFSVSAFFPAISNLSFWLCPGPFNLCTILL